MGMRMFNKSQLSCTVAERPAFRGMLQEISSWCRFSYFLKIYDAYTIICTYIYIYIYGTPRYLPFLYFYWYLRGFATDLHGWSLALVSRGGTGTIYIFICICFFLVMV